MRRGLDGLQKLRAAGRQLQTVRLLAHMETFGARNNHWVSATIDPRNPNAFTFETRMVPENVD